jgi:hypothetical protein
VRSRPPERLARRRLGGEPDGAGIAVADSPADLGVTVQRAMQKKA